MYSPILFAWRNWSHARARTSYLDAHLALLLERLPEGHGGCPADDGAILHYGETFPYNTIVHHAERFCGPPYRYDKIFPGQVTRADGTASGGTPLYHVKPPNMPFTLVRFPVDAMRDDALALLDVETRAWGAQSLEKSRRRFVIEDFESVPGRDA